MHVYLLKSPLSAEEFNGVNGRPNSRSIKYQSGPTSARFPVEPITIPIFGARSWVTDSLPGPCRPSSG